MTKGPTGLQSARRALGILWVAGISGGAYRLIDNQVAFGPFPLQDAKSPPQFADSASNGLPLVPLRRLAREEDRINR